MSKEGKGNFEIGEEMKSMDIDNVGDHGRKVMVGANGMVWFVYPMVNPIWISILAKLYLKVWVLL